jgi:chromosome segregation ATPase
MVPDYKREFEKERQRLAQIWDAYELQGAEMEKLQRHVERLEFTVHEKDQRIAALNETLAAISPEDRAEAVREAEVRFNQRDAELEIKLLTDNLRDQQEQFSQVFMMAEDLDKELKSARAEIEERDRLIAQLKTMLESKDDQLAQLRSG